MLQRRSQCSIKSGEIRDRTGWYIVRIQLKMVNYEITVLSNRGLGFGISCRFSRNTAKVTLTNIVFYYQKYIFIGSKYPQQKKNFLKKISLISCYQQYA